MRINSLFKHNYALKINTRAQLSKVAISSTRNTSYFAKPRKKINCTLIYEAVLSPPAEHITQTEHCKYFARLFLEHAITCISNKHNLNEFEKKPNCCEFRRCRSTITFSILTARFLNNQDVKDIQVESSEDMQTLQHRHLVPTENHSEKIPATSRETKTSSGRKRETVAAKPPSDNAQIPGDSD